MRLAIILIAFCAILYSCISTERLERLRAKDANISFEAEISKYKLEDFKTLTDIGCGDLASEKRISFLYPNTKFILIDDNPKVIQRVKKLIKIYTFNSTFNYKENCQVILGMPDSLPLADKTSELVLCRKTLHNFQDLNKMSQEISRILSNHGILIIVESEKTNNINTDSKSKKPLLFKEDIINLFQKNGLTLISSDTSNYMAKNKPVEHLNILRFQKQQ